MTDTAHELSYADETESLRHELAMRDRHVAMLQEQLAHSEEARLALIESRDRAIADARASNAIAYSEQTSVSLAQLRERQERIVALETRINELTGENPHTPV